MEILNDITVGIINENIPVNLKQKHNENHITGSTVGYLRIGVDGSKILQRMIP